MDFSQFRQTPGKTIRLSDHDPAAHPGLKTEAAAQKSIRECAERMIRHHDMLMAHEEQGLLVLFQGMDAAGKDEVIRDVLRALDPRGCEFKQFKRMSDKEARHDFLWRAAQAVPAAGQIGIFNRSYYEQVIVERVHPELLEAQKLPQQAQEGIWGKRFRQISAFETYLVENGIHVLKFFLHVSPEEQRLRLLERLESPETSWQFASHDVEEREHWDDYMRAYEEAITHTTTEAAPWYVLPGDRRWYSQAVIAAVIADKLQELHDAYPEPSAEERKEQDQARKQLERQGKSLKKAA